MDCLWHFPHFVYRNFGHKVPVLCTTQRSRHRCHKSVALFLHDLIFVAMGTLYLAGDNLPILICSGMSNTDDREDCIETSSIIIGFSLLMHTALYIAGSFKLNPAISTLLQDESGKHTKVFCNLQRSPYS